MDSYFIYTLPRSGSTLLTMMMRNLDPDLRYFGEVFGNSSYLTLVGKNRVKMVKREIPFLDLEGWRNENIRRWGIIKKMDPGFVLKVQGHHLDMNPEILQEICESYLPVCLIRKDYFSQVLSHVIGRRTGVWGLWTDETVQKHHDNLRRDPIRSDGEIEEWIRWFCEELQRHQDRMDAFERKEFIYYEDLIIQPEEELRKLGFQIPDGEIIPLPIPRVNPLNHLEAFQNPDQILDWYEQYRSIA